MQVPDIKAVFQASGDSSLLVLKSLLLALRYGAFAIPLVIGTFMMLAKIDTVARCGGEEEEEEGEEKEGESGYNCIGVFCAMILFVLLAAFVTLPAIMAYIAWVEFGYIVGTEVSEAVRSGPIELHRMHTMRPVWYACAPEVEALSYLLR